MPEVAVPRLDVWHPGKECGLGCLWRLDGWNFGGEQVKALGVREGASDECRV